LCISYSFSWSAVVVHGAGDVRTRSVGNIAGFGFREKAPHLVSVAGDC